ncbi:MAG: ATP synthase F1 subunit delta [Chloroflexi bacterium]|nr:ATP synthase F1 subunit delta [Chloroflexota bacterium]
MAKRGSAKRYAQAAFEIALERNELDRWQADLNRIATLLDNAALVALLEDPRVSLDRKTELLAGQLRDMTPLALNLVYLLIGKGRLSLMREIAQGYQKLVDGHRGIEHAQVVTVMPLDAEEEQHLAERLGAILGKKVIIEPKVDPTIGGGVIARIDYRVLDASVTGRLQALKREMVK